MAGLLWVGALLPLVAAVLLAYVGVAVLRRDAVPRDRLALRMFGAWWFSAAAIILLGSAPTLLSVMGASAMWVYDITTYATAVPLAVGLCGLLYYLVYIYTGRHELIRPLVIAYAAFFAFTIYYFAQFGGRHLEPTTFTIRLVSDVQPPAWLRAAYGVVVALPIVAAVVGYGLLLRRTHAAEQRYRLTLVSASFLLWFLPVLVAFLLGYDQADWFPFVYQVPGTLAALMITLAYRPPAFVERRWRAFT